MRGQLLARPATIHAEPIPLIAEASPRGRITMHEPAHRSRAIVTELLGLVAGQRAGPTA